MATSTEGVVGRGALLVGHAAGMLDLVSMPLWVGVLIQYRHLSPPEAGLLVTAYMIGVFLTSVSLARRFDRLPARLIAVGGFIVGALAFFAIVRIDGFVELDLIDGNAHREWPAKIHADSVRNHQADIRLPVV